MISVFISVFLPKEKHGDLTGDIKILKKLQENTQNIHSKQQENMKKKKNLQMKIIVKKAYICSVFHHRNSEKPSVSIHHELKILKKKKTLRS